MSSKQAELKYDEFMESGTNETIGSTGSKRKRVTGSKYIRFCFKIEAALQTALLLLPLVDGGMLTEW